jgi:putative transposase
VTFAFIEQHARTWPVRLMCRVLGVSPSGFYGWRSRPESARSASNRQLLDDVRRIHAAHHRRYGAPRVHAALRAEGRTVSRGRVERLMRHHGIRALAGRRFRPCTTDSRHDLPIAPNLLKQDFSAARPGTVWLADITYLPTGEGWLYLAAVLDLATRKIVGWSMRDHMRTELSVAALMMAAQRQRPAAGLICHSDRGSQYAAETYRKQLAAMGAKPSMSRTGWGLTITPRWRASSTPSRSSSSISGDGQPGTRRGATCSLTSRATTIGNASTRRSATSRPSRPSKTRAKLPVSAKSGEDQSPGRLPPQHAHASGRCSTTASGSALSTRL